MLAARSFAWHDELAAGREHSDGVRRIFMRKMEQVSFDEYRGVAAVIAI
jgi:hypothetical protein